jgi:hypothetical protein
MIFWFQKIIILSQNNILNLNYHIMSKPKFDLQKLSSYIENDVTISKVNKSYNRNKTLKFFGIWKFKRGKGLFSQ